MTEQPFSPHGVILPHLPAFSPRSTYMQNNSKLKIRLIFITSKGKHLILPQITWNLERFSNHSLNRFLILEASYNHKRIHAIWFHLGKVKGAAKSKQCNVYICGTGMKSESRQRAPFMGRGWRGCDWKRGTQEASKDLGKYSFTRCVLCPGVCFLKMNILWKVCFIFTGKYFIL